jgi:hypothetical protein
MYVIVAHDGSSSRESVTSLCGTSTDARPSEATGILDSKGRPIFRTQRTIGFYVPGVN